MRASTIVRTPPDSLLSQLAAACIDPPGIPELMSTSLPTVLEMTGAVSGLVLEPQGEELKLVARCGVPLPTDSLTADVLGVPTGWSDLSVPSDWRELGVQGTRAHPLTQSPGALVLLLTYDTLATLATHDAELEVVAALLQSAVSAARSAEALTDLGQRVDNAQMLANMGDYDWHIASDTNRWSDQLYRIYGHEPQSFNASYERFISHLHPDDRDRIMAVHQQAYASGEPYQMIERVRRPDGETRYLSSNGQVILDEEGTPVRMRGTCIDITDLVLAEQEVERVSARFEALVESSDDAIMVIKSGRVIQTNDRGRALLGGDPVGLGLDEFVQVDSADSLGVAGRGLTGEELTLDVLTRELNPGVDDDLVAVFLRDAAPRLASEALAVNLREAQVRRRQAVEINDNVLQSLTAAVYCLEDSDTGAAARYIQLTLASARDMMNDLLAPVDGSDIKPGDLVRQSAATLRTAAPSSAPTPYQAAPVAKPADLRVVIVDDSEDMRHLVGLYLERRGGIKVVGSAATGGEGVRLSAELRPDLVLLDLAMPDMDGLEALPLILTASPESRVIVLSGFDQRVGKQALALGAARFVQKGGGFRNLMLAIDETWPRGTPPQSAAC